MNISNTSWIIRIIVLGLILTCCNSSRDLKPPLLLTPVQMPAELPTNTTESPTNTTIPTESPTNSPIVEATATLYNEMAITPDTLFLISSPKLLNTPSSTNFCEHIPQPEIRKGGNELVEISGRVWLCVSRNWDVAFDLDTGSLVTSENPSGDIQLLRDKAALASAPVYYLYSANGALIEETGANAITYKNCENLSLSAIPPTVFFVTESAIACAVTSSGQVALIRVERIFPLDTDSVEFSFAILKK